jgi:DNA-binding transcriptional LysR family regulator
MFTSTKLRQIVAIDRAGSLSAATKVLNVSQSTLTKAVTDVEQDLGLAIFHRTARGVSATPEGREFLNRAERIVTDFDMLVEDTRSQKEQIDQFLRVSISPASQEGLYNRAIAHLLKTSPDICLNMVGLPVERGVRMLKRGHLDLLFAPTEDLAREPDFSVEELGTLYPRLFCRREHPILSEPQISLEMLEKYRVILPDYHIGYAKRMAEFRLLGNVDPRRRFHIIENFVMTQTAIAESDLIGIVGSTYGRTRSFQANFALLDLDVFPPLNMGVAQLSRWLPSRAARACLAAVRKFPPDAEA